MINATTEGGFHGSTDGFLFLHSPFRSKVVKPATLKIAGGVLIGLGLVLGVLGIVLGPKSAAGELALDLKFKDRVIGGAYKAYG